MKTHYFRLYGNIIPFIRDGSKTLEVRTSQRFFSDVEVGDIIIFSHCTCTTSCKVNGIRTYRDFEEMLGTEDPSKIMPGWTSKQVLEGLRDLYSRSFEALGVVVFEIKVSTI